ncbi:hypothetical protein B0T14DRAFT_101965 [Immersiella caudata]|uniref:Uncharacterized protein n=1 Tax=Immersiella caudata TaxID=314043 RepID=A0AA39X3N8_9PEZI|nr:hypothetical protein B0T14DRAFT_101965 [Immersiella caudata]
MGCPARGEASSLHSATAPRGGCETVKGFDGLPRYEPCLHGVVPHIQTCSRPGIVEATDPWWVAEEGNRTCSFSSRSALRTVLTRREVDTAGGCGVCAIPYPPLNRSGQREPENLVTTHTPHSASATRNCHTLDAPSCITAPNSLVLTALLWQVGRSQRTTDSSNVPFSAASVSCAPPQPIRLDVAAGPRWCFGVPAPPMGRLRYSSDTQCNQGDGGRQRSTLRRR